MYEELIAELREEAEWAKANEWETPIMLSDHLTQAADAIEELSKPRWIPAEERLPEEMDRSRGEWSAEIRPSDDVLVWLSHEKRQSVAWYSHTYNEWTTVDENTVYCFGEVTHWMPLPEPPKPKEPTFKDVFWKKFPKAIYLDVNCCAIFPEQFVRDSCDCNCEACWNQPYFDEEEGGE